MTTTTPTSPITTFLDALHDHLSHYHDERSQTLQLKLSTLRREIRKQDANLNQNILDMHRQIVQLQTAAVPPPLELIHAIRDVLDGVAWTADTPSRIAALLTAAGYPIRDLDDHPVEPGIPVPAARARVDEPTAASIDLTDPRALLSLIVRTMGDCERHGLTGPLSSGDALLSLAPIIRALLARPEAPPAPPAPLWAAYAGSALGEDLSLHKTRREALEAVCSALGLDDDDELDPEDVRLNADLDDDDLAERISTYCEGRADDWCVSEVEVPK